MVKIEKKCAHLFVDRMDYSPQVDVDRVHVCVVCQFLSSGPLYSYNI